MAAAAAAVAAQQQVAIVQQQQQQLQQQQLQQLQQQQQAKQGSPPKPTIEQEDKNKMPKIQKKQAPPQQAAPIEDPSVTQIQKKIAQFVDSKGRLSNQDYVLMFVKIMAAEKQEKARLVLVNLLESATNPNCLKKYIFLLLVTPCLHDRFVEVNGLNVLNNWLIDYKTNVPTLQALFKVSVPCHDNIVVAIQIAHYCGRSCGIGSWQNSKKASQVTRIAR